MRRDIRLKGLTLACLWCAIVMSATRMMGANGTVQDILRTYSVRQKRQSYAGPVQRVAEKKSCCATDANWESCDSDAWITMCLDAIQQTSGDYRSVVCTFNVPSKYLFDSYLLYLFNVKTGYPTSISKDIKMSSQEIIEESCNGAVRNVTKYTFTDVPPGTYRLMLKPTPSPEQCTCSGLTCNTSRGQPFTVIPNPCDSSPCGHGDCHPIEDMPVCSCHLGYKLKDDTCVADPCNRLEGNTTYNPCNESIGTCRYKDGQGNSYDYYCQCSDGYAPPDMYNKTCKVDPCYSKPCGDYGTCHIKYTEPGTELQHECTCDEGYLKVDDTCKADPCNSKPCGDNGTCHVESTEPATELKHGCTCDEGFLEVDDTCKANPCNDVHLCEFGLCAPIKAPDLYSCYNCTTGYHLKNNKCVKITKSSTPTTIIIAIMLGAALGLSLIVITYCILWPSNRRRCRNKYEEYIHNDFPQMISDSFVNNRRHQTTPNVLLLYTDGTDFNRSIIRAVATFLEKHCACHVKLGMFSKTENVNINVWLTDNLAKANKVLLMCSEESKTNWESNNLAAAPQTCSSSDEDLFLMGYQKMKESCGLSQNSDNRWMAAHMKYTAKCDVLQFPDCVPVFELPREIEGLYSFIHHDNPEAVIPQNLNSDLMSIALIAENDQYVILNYLNGSRSSSANSVTFTEEYNSVTSENPNDISDDDQQSKNSGETGGIQQNQTIVLPVRNSCILNWSSESTAQSTESISLIQPQRNFVINNQSFDRFPHPDNQESPAATLLVDLEGEPRHSPNVLSDSHL